MASASAARSRRTASKSAVNRWRSTPYSRMHPAPPAEPARLASNVQIDMARRAGGRHGERLPRREPLLYACLAGTHRDHHVRHMGVASECPDEAPMREGKLHAENADRSRLPRLDERTVAPGWTLGAALTLRAMIVPDRCKAARVVARHRRIEGARAELVWRALAACVSRVGRQDKPDCRHEADGRSDADLDQSRPLWVHIGKRHGHVYSDDAPDLRVLVFQPEDPRDAFLALCVAPAGPTSMKSPARKTATVQPLSSLAA
jgi:hypothetical protein